MILLHLGCKRPADDPKGIDQVVIGIFKGFFWEFYLKFCRDCCHSVTCYHSHRTVYHKWVMWDCLKILKGFLSDSSLFECFENAQRFTKIFSLSFWSLTADWLDFSWLTCYEVVTRFSRNYFIDPFLHFLPFGVFWFLSEQFVLRHDLRLWTNNKSLNFLIEMSKFYRLSSLIVFLR